MQATKSNLLDEIRKFCSKAAAFEEWDVDATIALSNVILLRDGEL